MAVRIIDNGTVKYFNKMINWANVNIKGLTFEQSQKGAEYMAALMPKKTGSMIQGVSAEARRNSYAIISRTPNNPDGRRRTYHVYYNYGGTGRRRTPNDPAKMYYYEKTEKYLGKEYPKRILNDFDSKFK